MPKFINARAAGFYDADAVSFDTGLLCKDPSLAIQSQAQDADINVIVERFKITGEVPVHQRHAFPIETDIDEVLDYRACMDAINAANRAFMDLPAKVRSTFSNDPIVFADFASDPKNLDQLREWGLAPPAPAPVLEAPPGS